MTKKRTFYGNMKRNIAVGMAALTLATTCMGTAVKVHAEEPDSDTYIETEGPLNDIAKGLMSGYAGCVPGVGPILQGGVSAILDCIWPEENELASIQSSIKNLSLQMEGEAQTILKRMYDDQLAPFNKDMTNLRELTCNYLSDINTHMTNNNMNEIEKAIAVGCLFEGRSSNLEDYTNIIDSSCKYITGTAVDQYDHESIFVKAYKSACDKTVEHSALGGEAAVKAAPYVNEVANIVDNAQRVEAMVLDAKISLANQLRKLDDEQYKALKNEYENRYKELALISEARDPKQEQLKIWQDRVNDLKTQHDLLFDENNANSVVSRYNKMVDGYRFCYISKSDYSKKPAAISYIPLKSEMIGTDMWECGLEKTINEWKEGWKNTMYFVDGLKDFLGKSGLTWPQIREISQAMENTNKNYNPNHEERTVFAAMRDYGFNIDEVVRKDSAKYKVADASLLSDEELLEAAKPQILSNWDMTRYGNFYAQGYDLLRKAIVDDNKIFTIDDYDPAKSRDLPYHRFVGFQKGTMPEDPWQGFVGTADEIDALTDELQSGMVDALTINGVEEPEENNLDNPEENEAIVLTVDENGQIFGDKMNEAWTVAEDGTIILNKDNKFRFEGTVADRNIQNNGEIVDGNFKNVKMELVDNAVITKGTFEDCEITTNENAVIGEEVEFINTTIIDAKEIENKEEEEQKENQEDVVEDTPVSEQDVF